MNWRFLKASYVRTKIIHQSIYTPKFVDVQSADKKYRQLFEAFDGKFNAKDEKAYQAVVAVLAKQPLTFPGLLQRHVAGQQKGCPDLVLNDIMAKVVQSDLLSEAKLETIDRILNWYYYSINDKIQLYLESCSEEMVFNQEDTAKKAEMEAALLKDIQNLISSYQIVLTHLCELSQKSSLNECFKNLDSAFSLDYNVRYIKIVFNIISNLPMSDKLFIFAVNLLTFLNLNKMVTLNWSLLLLYMSSEGMHQGLKGFSNIFLIWRIVPIIFALTPFLLTLRLYFSSFKDIENHINFNNNRLMPLLYLLGIRQYLYSFFY